MNNNQLKNLEEKVKNLKIKSETNEVTDIDYRNELREVLTEVEGLIESRSSLFSIMSRKELKKTIAMVEEAFLTSPYADNIEERTAAVLFLKNLKTTI